MVIISNYFTMGHFESIKEEGGGGGTCPPARRTFYVLTINLPSRSSTALGLVRRPRTEVGSSPSPSVNGRRTSEKGVPKGPWGTGGKREEDRWGREWIS